MNSPERKSHDYTEKIDSLIKLPFVIETINLDKCHVPSLPSPLFHFQFNKTAESKITCSEYQSKLVLPESPLVKTSLTFAQRLSSGIDVKETLELTFRFEDEIVEYDPGDSFGFICSNDSKEVDLLLNRLGLQNVADIPTNLMFDEAASAKKKLLMNIPPMYSLREIFLRCVEIRAIPKKVLIRILSNYAFDEMERKCLLFLSSQEGSDFFEILIRKPYLTILDILLQYPSCMPPVEKIIEYLPPLKPRFYSVASSPLVDSHIFRIVFNVLSLKSGCGRQLDKEGVCTGWLKHAASNILPSFQSNILDKLSALQLHDDQKLFYIYKRKNLHFKFPDKLKNPLIMVGPGTGVAPFIGYLQHREKIMKMNNLNASELGETWLFYGCRYKERDFLYKNELDRLLKSEVLTHLIVSFSRDTQESDIPLTKYVHENIKLHAEQIVDCIKCGRIFVCGDARNMASDVHQAFIQVLQIGAGITESQAKTAIENMKKEHRYVSDVWA